MAIYKPSPLAGAISGNLGGVNFSDGKSGPILRKPIQRTRKDTVLQQANRIRHQFVRSGWRTLTDQQRTEWTQAAQTYPHSNRLGVRTRMTGFSLYLMVNMYAWSVTFLPGGLRRSWADLNRFPAFPALSLDITSGAGPYNLINDDPLAVPTPQMTLFGARTFSTAVRRSWNTFTTFTQIANDAADVDFSAAFITAFGQIEIGEQLFIKAIPSPLQERLGSPVIISATAHA